MTSSRPVSADRLAAGSPVARSDAIAWSVKDLRFRYRRNLPELFDGLTYRFSPGMITGLTGPSGRGKSTLLYVLGLLLRPSSGSVMLGAEDVAALSDALRSVLRAEEIGFVFQDSQLDPARPIEDSVAEPGLYAQRSLRQCRPGAFELLERFGLGREIGKLPSQISGGQAQRVAVCRALFASPALVLADEPTGNLDRSNAALVLDALAGAAAEGRTVVVATHDPFVLEHCADVLEL